jgi:N-acyl-D-aspartate/D-glutamate deacylase
VDADLGCSPAQRVDQCERGALEPGDADLAILDDACQKIVDTFEKIA